MLLETFIEWLCPRWALRRAQIRRELALVSRPTPMLPVLRGNGQAGPAPPVPPTPVLDDRRFGPEPWIPRGERKRLSEWTPWDPGTNRAVEPSGYSIIREQQSSGR
jgi:hypothetical protein